MSVKRIILVFYDESLIVSTVKCWPVTLKCKCGAMYLTTRAIDSRAYFDTHFLSHKPSDLSLILVKTPYCQHNTGLMADVELDIAGYFIGCIRMAFPSEQLWFFSPTDAVRAHAQRRAVLHNNEAARRLLSIKLLLYCCVYFGAMSAMVASAVVAWRAAHSHQPQQPPRGPRRNVKKRRSRIMTTAFGEDKRARAAAASLPRIPRAVEGASAESSSATASSAAGGMDDETAGARTVGWGRKRGTVPPDSPLLEDEVGRRCKLDPGLKAPHGFKISTLIRKLNLLST